MNEISNFMDAHGTLLLCIVWGLFLILCLFSFALSDIQDRKRKNAIASWHDSDKGIPTIKDIQKQLVEMGSDICIDGKLSSEMEHVWNELSIGQYEADGAVKKWLCGE